MATAEVTESVNQMAAVFAAAMEALSASREDFERISCLSIGITIRHPASGTPGRGRRSYSNSLRTYFVEAPINYAQWATASWELRTDTFADTIRGAIARVPTTRITDMERAALDSHVEHMRWSISKKPPNRIAPIKSIFLVYGGDSTSPSQISFDSTVPKPADCGKVVEVLPEDAMSVARETSARESTSRVPGFKLYQRLDDQLLYHECWKAGSVVIEHWGTCGGRGAIRDHSVTEDAETKRVIQKLKNEARSRGFGPIPPSRHSTLVVEYTIDGFGSESDLERRHALEDFLNEQTGWLGLGHCDGGSSGSGSMEAFCVVVDFELARVVLSYELERSSFGVPTRIYRLR